MERCGGSTSPCAMEFVSVARERGWHKGKINGKKGEREIQREREREKERKGENNRKREESPSSFAYVRMCARNGEEISRRKIEREEEKEEEKGDKIFSPLCMHARVCEEKRERRRGANLSL